MHACFCCESENCHPADGKPYQIAIQSEAIMDENNLASIFCPHCRTPLVRCRPNGACADQDG